MADQEKRFTRQELYELVWSKPMTKVAAGFGISDVAVKKICRKFNVPVPGRGYWRKLETGKKVRSIALPPVSNEASIRIGIRERQSEPPASAVLSERLESEQSPENRIEVPATIPHLHQLAKIAELHLRSAKPDEYGMVKFGVANIFQVRVGANSVDRLVRILDTLLKQLEHRDFLVLGGKKESSGWQLVISGEPVSFAIEDSAERKAHRMTEEEKERRKQWSYFSGPLYDYVPRGKFVFKCPVYETRGVGDSARINLEERLNECVILLVGYAEKRRAQNLEQEARQRRIDEENARRAEVRRLREEESKRVERLVADAEAWQSAERLRRYIAAAEKAAHLKGIDTSVGSPHQEWVRWAILQSERVDPLCETPPSILDEEDCEPLTWWNTRSF